jgi:hypothetical protein
MALCAPSFAPCISNASVRKVSPVVHERSRALEAGYDWHLAKPLDPPQVVATVLAAKNSPPVR